MDAPGLALGPEWTIPQAAELHQALLGLLEGEFGPMALDLSGVESMDSSGVQLLLALRVSCQARGQELSLQRPSSAVRAAFAVYGLEL